MVEQKQVGHLHVGGCHSPIPPNDQFALAGDCGVARRCASLGEKKLFVLEVG